MGGGSYNITASRSRSMTYSTRSREEVFSRRYLDPDMDPRKASVRESRDSEEHPESFPIIIALDETGSMGHIPEKLIKGVFPTIMEKILDAGVPNPQVMFMGIGDSITGREAAPLQVGQFESSDELMEKWLTKIYLEGCGGGNGHESYPLAWFFAAKHIETDAWEKRGIKGVLITIGDEPCQKLISQEELKRYLDDYVEEDITASSILEKVQQKWNVFHIHCDKRTYDFEETNWEKLLGINAVMSTHPHGEDIADIIPKLVVSCYKKDN